MVHTMGMTTTDQRTDRPPEGWTHIGGLSDIDTIGDTMCAEIDLGGHRFWFRLDDIYSDLEGNAYLRPGAEWSIR